MILPIFIFAVILMKNIFIEDTRVSSYVENLTREIRATAHLNGIKNLYIVGIGESGLKVSIELVQKLLESGELEFDVYPIAVDRLDGETPTMQWIRSASEQLPISALGLSSDHVILVDGIARTGKTLLKTYDEFTRAFRSAKIWSYAIAVCQSSAFIPSWYGILYDDHAHVILARDGGTPNISLFESRDTSPAVALRLPRADDPEFAITKPESMVRYTVFDRHFDHTTSSKRIYVLEWDSVPIGYVAFHLHDRTLWLDSILICENHSEKKGAGSALLSHVENFAKASACERIALWAIENREKWYRNRNFLPLSDKVSIGHGTNSEDYVPMAMALRSDMSHYF